MKPYSFALSLASSVTSCVVAVVVSFGGAWMVGRDVCSDVPALQPPRAASPAKMALATAAPVAMTVRRECLPAPRAASLAAVADSCAALAEASVASRSCSLSTESQHSFRATSMRWISLSSACSSTERWSPRLTRISLSFFISHCMRRLSSVTLASSTLSRNSVSAGSRSLLIEPCAAWPVPLDRALSSNASRSSATVHLLTPRAYAPAVRPSTQPVPPSSVSPCLRGEKGRASCP